MYAISPIRTSENGDSMAVLDKVEDTYNWEGVNFPASFDEIAIFENNNSICVNIFGYSEEKTKLTRTV